MFHIERFKNFFGFRQIANRNLKETFSAFTEFFYGRDEENGKKKLSNAFLSLALPLISTDGHINGERRTIFRTLLEEHLERTLVEDLMNALAVTTPAETESSAEFLRITNPEIASKTAKFLGILAVAVNARSGDIAYVRKTAAQLGVDNEEFSAFFRKITEEEQKKQRLRNSSRGIIAALVIIAVFMLTAKYLQSVIFGLLLACILLPLEHFFERRLASGKGLVFWLITIFTLPVKPLKKLAEAITRRETPASAVTPAEAEKKSRQKIIRQSVSLCCIMVLLFAGILTFGISKLTGHYMKNLQNSIRNWENEQISSLKGENTPQVSKYNIILEKIRSELESVPLVNKGFEHLEKMISNPEFRDNAIKNVISKSGGIVNFAGTVIGGIVSILCDLLLTLFFALLFLLKFAEFRNSKNGRHSGSEYIVRMFFNGIWLPGADESVIRETCRIIDGITFRFRTWLKGYLTLILVDSTVYTTCFFFLGVPFFFPLGVVAGCGIALPYLGPVISCALTLLVTIVAGSASMEILIAIIICYLIYNGIVEQFILYPAVIGESLGLSTLETIIVVLLGAIIAGIPGMIFALPTASIAKYLIPQIYRGFSVKSVLPAKTD
ncbi:MAG: AI-2E family transporter [Lentisphaeria bacterium]|nr:AI-2E family transporter [Lentisphaeria bacterium]